MMRPKKLDFLESVAVFIAATLFLCGQVDSLYKKTPVLFLILRS